MTGLSPRVALKLSVALLGGSLIAGCGVLFGWATLPAAVATNSNFSFAGHVIDVDQKPIDGCLVKMELDHLVWAPVEGMNTNERGFLRKIGPAFSFATRGTSTKFTFSHDGYYDRALSFEAADTTTVIAPEGSWPNIKDFPVVLHSTAKIDHPLHYWSSTVQYDRYPNSPAIDPMDKSEVSIHRLNAEDPGKIGPGILYLTLVKVPPKVLDAKGTVDPTSLNLPGSLSLHITGEDGGFIRIVPKIGYPPLGVNNEAPTEGYTPEFTIDQKRLVEMRDNANASRVIEGSEYFFFRANGRYGKGQFSWHDHWQKGQTQPVELSFTYVLWTQPIPGNRELFAACSCP